MPTTIKKTKPIKTTKKQNPFKALFTVSTVLLLGAAAGIPITYYLVPQKNSGGGGGGDTPLPDKVSLEMTYPFLNTKSKMKMANILGLAPTKKYEFKYFFNDGGTDYNNTGGGTFTILKNNSELWYSPVGIASRLIYNTKFNDMKFEIFEVGKTEPIFTDTQTRYLAEGGADGQIKIENTDKIEIKNRVLVATTGGYTDFPGARFNGFFSIFGDASIIEVTDERVSESDSNFKIFMQLKVLPVTPIMGYLAFDTGEGAGAVALSSLITIE